MDPVCHVGAKRDHPIGVPVKGIAQLLQESERELLARHLADGQTGVRVKIHAPVDVGRASDDLKEQADDRDEWRRGESDHGIGPG